MKIFSGIQPTSQIHIGNYLGAIKQWIKLQDEHECIFCIVDLHALTVPYEIKTFQQKIMDIASAYLASGIDPKKSIIFVQSKVKEHSELCWLLSTITSMGDLQRMTQFKEKSAKHSNNSNAGLFNYPVLMASDILLYDTDLVPVGDDQKQHVELAREIAKRFNHRFSTTFKTPQALISKTGARIMSLTKPEKKMSKSDPYQSYISLFDSPEEITKKISSAQTDSEKIIQYDPVRKKGISNLLTIYSLFADQPIKSIEKQFQNKGYREFKQSLARILTQKLEPFREKRNLFQKKAEKALAQGALKAQEIAQKKMKIIKKNMGL